MHSIHQFFLKISKSRQKASLAQRCNAGYIFILIIILLISPLLSIRSISDDSVLTLQLFSAYGIKTSILLLLYTTLFILRNFSEWFRNRCYILFGFQAPKPFISFCILMTMLCYLLIISDIVLVVKEYLSNNISLHWGYLLLSIRIFVGMLWQLIIARLQWKQKQYQQEIHITTEQYNHRENFDTNHIQEKTLF